MQKMLSWCRRGLFAGAMAAALGFGASQAFAGPAAQPEAQSCDQAYCRATCISAGHSGGRCVTTPAGSYCECISID